MFEEENLPKLTNYLSNFNLDYEVVKSFDGHTGTIGRSSGKKNINHYYIVTDKNNQEFILLYVGKELYTLIDKSKIDYLKENNNTWFICQNGYVASNFDGHQLYLHQFLLNYFGNGKGQMSIDHINRNKLDNRIENLRVVNSSIQNSNMDKKKRSKTAQPLPPGITQESIPKYVHYYSETMHKGTLKECRRDFFKIEHPSLEKPISTSKSTKVSIFQKLQQATQLISEITQGTYQPPTKQLPTYVQLKKIKEKSYLIFDKREGSQRLNLKMVLPESYQLEEQIKVFSDKIINKYNLNILT